MPTDQVVLPKDLLRALSDMKRNGAQRALADLEIQEPDLVEFMLGEICGIHQQILKAGVRCKDARLTNARQEALALVCVIALRCAHARLFEELSPQIISRLSAIRQDTRRRMKSRQRARTI